MSAAAFSRRGAVASISCVLGRTKFVTHLESDVRLYSAPTGPELSPSMPKRQPYGVDDVMQGPMESDPQTPRDTVYIGINEFTPLDAVSKVFSYVAYPDAADYKVRVATELALYRLGLLLDAQREPHRAREPQLVRPEAFLASDSDYERLIHRGIARASQFVFVAATIVAPHMRALLKGQPIGRPNPHLHAMLKGTPVGKANKPRVEDIIIERVLPVLDMKLESVSTVKSRLWAPAKPSSLGLGSIRVPG